MYRFAGLKQSISMPRIQNASARRSKREVLHKAIKQEGGRMTLPKITHGFGKLVSRNPFLTTPPNRGYALPTMTATVSSAAPTIRAAAIRANPGSYEIPVKPRSILDQKNLPCCVSCALGAAMEIRNPSWPALAPLFHYHVTRFEETGGANTEGFLYLDVALITLTNTGICREALHRKPYTKTGAKEKPSNDSYDDAKRRKLGYNGDMPRYSPVSGVSKVAWIREQLRQDRPVVIGFTLPKQEVDDPLFVKPPSFAWLEPGPFRPSPTGHCVLATGYDDFRGVIHIQDSQGAGKFDKGRWWMGYKVMDSIFFQEAYSITS